MLKSFLRISFRNLVRQKSYSLISIFGLTLGLTCCILILTHIGYELSYDSYHRNADRIYRLASQRVSMGTTNEFATVPAPTGPAMVEDVPEVIGAVRFSPTVKRAFSYGDKKFFQENVFYPDRSVFEVFSFDLIEGDPETALEAPFTMVVTEKTARKYFGGADPIGKFVNWDNKFDYQVTGVVKDPPANSHFTFEVLAINNDDVRRGLDAFKTEVLRMPEVVSAGASFMVPGEMYLFNLPTFPEGFPRELALRMDNFLVDDGFVGTFGIEVIKGRAFSREVASDRTEAVMINETAARKLQWDDPIGKTIELRAAFSDDTAKKKVIGVFRDIHYPHGAAHPGRRLRKRGLQVGEGRPGQPGGFAALRIRTPQSLFASFPLISEAPRLHFLANVLIFNTGVRNEDCDIRQFS